MSALPKMADKKSLKNLVPLNGLTATHFEELAKKATVLELKPGKYLFKKGERDSSTCYILEGEIALVDGSDIKLTIEGGTEEAKHPIAPQQPRQLGARAKTHCTIISVDSGLLDVMLSWEQSASYEVDDIESDEEDWMTRMMQSDLLQRLPATNLQQLFIRMEEVDTKASEVVVYQDDEGDYYYIIKQGTCIVSRKPSANAREVKLAELTDGDSFGEESLLSGAKRNASVTMLTDGKLMRLSKKDFNELLKSPLLSHVTYDQAKPLIQDGAILLDVRLPGEYTNAHLENSINLPLAAIRNEISNIDREKEYIVYCDTGRRSTSAVFLLGQFGIDANVLKDGLSSVPLEDYATTNQKEAASAEIIDINRDRADVADTGPLVAELKTIKKEKAQLEENLKNLSLEVDSLKTQIGKSEEKIASRESELQETKNLIQNEQDMASNLEEELQGLRAVEIESDKLKEQLAKVKEQLEEKEKLLKNSQESDESLQKKLLSQQEKIKKFERDLKKARERESDAEQVNEANVTELEALNVTLLNLQSEKAELSNKLESIEREKDALGEDVDASVGALNAELEGLRTTIGELQENRAKIDSDLQQERQQMELLRQQLQAKDAEQQTLTEKMTSIGNELEVEKSKSQQVATEKAAIENELQVLRGELENGSASSSEKITALENQINEFQQSRLDLESQLELSTTLADALQSELHDIKQSSESAIAEREAQQQSLLSQLNETASIRSNLEADIQGLNEKMSGYEASLAELRTNSEQQARADEEKIKSLEVSLARASEDKSVREAALQEELAGYQQSQQRLEADLQAITEKANEYQNSLETLTRENDARQQESHAAVEKLQAELDEVNRKNAQRESDLVQQTNDSKNQYQEATLEIEKLTARVKEYEAGLSASNENVERQTREFTDKIKLLESELENKNKNNNDLQQTIESLQAAEQQYRQDLDLSRVTQEQVDDYKHKFAQVEKDRNSIDEQLTQSRKRIEELSEINKQLEAGNQDEALQLNLQELRCSLNDAEQKLQEKDRLISEKSDEENELRKELAALRAVYVQKDSDVSRLQNDLNSAQEKISEFEKNDENTNKSKQAAIEELSLVRGIYEQSEKENSERIVKLETELKEKQQQLNEYNDKANEAVSLKTDAESAFKVMEGEIEKIRRESDQYQKTIHDSNEQIIALRSELEKLQEQQKSWRVTEDDLAKNNELEMSRARVSELEDELRQVHAKLELSEVSVQQQKTLSNDQQDINIQLSQLKSEMESQMDRYKSELDDESNKLREENKGLHDELKKLHMEHEMAIKTGQEAAGKIQPDMSDAHQAAEEKDHSALFDLPDIDKNLFNNNAGTTAPKSNWLMTIIVALLFSLFSAATVYWYFVMSKSDQVTIVQQPESDNEVSNQKTINKQAMSSPGVKDKQQPSSGKNLANASEAISRKKESSPARTADGLKPTRIFSDFLQSGGSGPVMVGVPGGIFSMGSPANSTYFDERPQHKVSLRQYSISKFEVSFEDYDRFSADSGRPRPSDNGWGRGKRPVINITWDDAIAYTQWLSKQTGHEYRLPSEAEWEYAARSGSKERYWWGADYKPESANCFNCGSQWDRISSAPIGSFSANSLGLHDMTGNVMEWVMDCYTDNYDGAPIDGAARQSAACQKRVVRDGSYHSTSENIRVTKRSGYPQDSAVDQIGFRIVRVR